MQPACVPGTVADTGTAAHSSAQAPGQKYLLHRATEVQHSTLADCLSGRLSSQTPKLTALLRLFRPFFHKNIAVFSSFRQPQHSPQRTSSPPSPNLGLPFSRARNSHTHGLGQMLLLPEHAERVSSLALARRYAPLSDFNRRASYTRQSPPNTARGVCSLVRPG